MDRLIRNLQAMPQQLIEISFEGTQSAPIHVQQQTLEHLSPYFATALKKETFIEGKNGKLSFPADEKEVWEVILHWIFKRTLPGPQAAEDLELAVRCWIAGDKYELEMFQDAVMLRILRRLNWMGCDDLGFNFSIVLLVFERTAPRSGLQALFAEWMVMCMQEEEVHSLPVFLSDIVARSFKGSRACYKVLDGTGFYPAIMENQNILDQGDVLSWRRNPSDIHDDPQWRQFFVSAADKYDCRCEKCG